MCQRHYDPKTEPDEAEKEAAEPEEEYQLKKVIVDGKVEKQRELSPGEKQLEELFGPRPKRGG